MIWELFGNNRDGLLIYYDGLCAWVLYGDIGSPSRSEMLFLEEGVFQDPCVSVPPSIYE